MEVRRNLNWMIYGLLFWQESYDRAKAVLKAHNAEFHALAKALLEHETLDADEIKTILEGRQLKRKS